MSAGQQSGLGVKVQDDLGEGSEYRKVSGFESHRSDPYFTPCQLCDLGEITESLCTSASPTLKWGYNCGNGSCAPGNGVGEKTVA